MPRDPGVKPNEGEFTWRQKRFARWCAIPASRRPSDCKTQGQYAQLMGVSNHTLWKWKSLPGFWTEVFKYAQSIIGEQIPDILKAMAAEASLGSVSAARFCMEMMGLTGETGASVVFSEPLTIILPAGTAPPALPSPRADSTNVEHDNDTDTDTEPSIRLIMPKDRGAVAGVDADVGREEHEVIDADFRHYAEPATG